MVDRKEEMKQITEKLESGIKELFESEKYREYLKYIKDAGDAKEMLDEGGLDRDMKELAQSEFDEARATQSHLQA